MGNNASKPEDDVCFEGKFFTTGDGIKLSSSVVKRLSQDEREAKEHRAKLEAQAKAQADERAQKSAEEQAILDNKFNDLERSHQEQRIMLEKERDRNYQMMNEYDELVGNREMQIHKLLLDLEGEREKLESRLKEKESTLSDVTNKLSAEIQAEKDKLSGYQEIFADRVQLMEDQFSAVTADLSQQISAERHKFVEVTNCLTEQIHHEQDKLEQISTVAYQEFEDAAKKIEEKFQPAGSKAVCSDTESSLLECYKTNPRKPLLCNKQLQHFKECVAASKKEMFARRGLASE